MDGCTCGDYQGLQMYDLYCPTCGIYSSERDEWCCCDDPNLTCPVHTLVCPCCKGEITPHETLTLGKCSDCHEVYGE